MSAQMTGFVSTAPLSGGTSHCLIESFLGYLCRTGRTASTATKYRHTLELFSGMAGGCPLALHNATEIDTLLQEWHAQYTRARGRPPSAATYRNHVAALRSYYSYLERFELLRDDAGRV